MKSEWNHVQLSDIMNFKNGKKRPASPGNIPVYGGNGILGFVGESNNQNCIIIGRVGAYCGSVFYESQRCWVSDNAICCTAKENSDIAFDYYLLKGLHLNERHIGTSQPLLTQEILNRIEILSPSLPEQRRIGSLLSLLDNKIELNQKINENLERQVTTQFQQMFTETENDERHICRADEYFDISIGKTPPRKEPQWFSSNSVNCTWVSISDMGNCGLYISDSSEYLTHDAVAKFNIKIVPNNTVLLSFKLTVGRVAITDGAMTTNEAIAHFKTNKPEINEYLYCYLKSFNYQTMGSTSSIATAVNSKIIKGMPFVIPTDEELAVFHRFSASLFAMIKSNQRENVRLIKLRDTLLPKLMAGEIAL